MRVGRRIAAVALGAVLTLIVASCAPADSTAPNASGSEASAVVNVNTPHLRALKRQAGVAPCRPGAASAITDGLPELTLPCLGGGPAVDLGALRGPMVINLFAQYCGPCRTELPYYQKLHEQGRGQLHVLGIDYLDTQPDAALQLIADSGVTYPLLADPGSRLRAPLRVRALPMLVMIDAAGEVVYRQAIAVSSYADLQGLVAEHLGVTV